MKKTTKGFTIEYPEQSIYGTPSLFKVFFGRKYLIWKGKSFYQSLEYLSSSIKQCIDKGNKDETHFMYHVAAHIIKNGVMGGICHEKDIYTDFSTETKEFDGYKILVDEQDMIDDAIRSSLCLNNNVQAYVPNNTAYINSQQKQRFLKWYEKNHK